MTIDEIVALTKARDNFRDAGENKEAEAIVAILKRSFLEVQ